MVSIKRKVTLRKKHHVTLRTKQPDASSPSSVLPETAAQTHEEVPPVAQSPQGDGARATSSSHSSRWIAAAVALLVIGGGAYFALNSSKHSDTSAAESSVAQTKSQSTSGDTSVSSATSSQGTTTASEASSAAASTAATTATEGSPAPAASPAATTSGSSSSPAHPADEATSATPETSEPTATAIETAREVMRGKYGNGLERKQRLGGRYREVQRKVNEFYGIR